MLNEVAVKLEGEKFVPSEKQQFIRKTLREQLADILRSKILRSEIAPGDRIVEEEVAKEYQVSRGPIREALRQLEEEGLISYQPHKGCVVKTLSLRDMQESYLIRSTLESLAVQIYAGKISENGLRKMEEALEDIRMAGENKTLYELTQADEAFHSAIVEEAECEKLLKIWRQLQGANTSTYYTMNTENLMPYDFVAANHKVILDLFKNSASVDQISHEIHKHYMVVPETLSQKEQQRGKE